MRISVLTIGAVASILSINSVFADTTVTTQSYVDTKVETKQDKIAGHPTTRLYPNSVITDTTTDGVIEKRLVVAAGNGFRGLDMYPSQLPFGNLVNLLKDQAESIGLTEGDLKNGVISAGLIDEAFKFHHDLIFERQKNKVCVQYITGAEETSENCLLWNLPD